MLPAHLRTLAVTLALSALPALSAASPTPRDSGFPDGVYRVITRTAPSPILVIEQGRIVRSFGELKDSGCDTRQAGTVEQNIDLARLFNEVPVAEKNSRLYRQKWHSTQWNGKSPFAFSTVRVAMNNEADLQLTHTVSTFLVNPAHSGTTLCSRYHHYKTRKFN